MTTERDPGSVEKATRADLRARGVSVESDALAALAVATARRVDQEGDGKTAAALARELRAAMVEVARAHPIAVDEGDEVDELRARRAARRGA